MLSVDRLWFGHLGYVITAAVINELGFAGPFDGRLSVKFFSNLIKVGEAGSDRTLAMGG